MSWLEVGEPILLDGRRVMVPRLCRGARLVESEEEWTSRQRRILRFYVCVLFLGVFVEMTLMNIDDIGVGFEDITSVLVFALLMASIQCAVCGPVWYLMVVKGRSPKPGVYANGVQLPAGGIYHNRTFLPFDQIDGIEWNRAALQGRSDWSHRLRLHVRGLRRPVSLAAMSFGRANLAEIERIVLRRAQAPTSAPRLILYGTSLA